MAQLPFNVLLDRTWKRIQVQVMKFSARTSPCSALPTEYRISQEYLTSSRNCLALLVGLEFIPGVRDYYRVEQLRVHVARMARRYNFQGGWVHVKDYLESVPPFNVRSSLLFIVDIMSLDDYFGNFLPLLLKTLSLLRAEEIRPKKEWELPKVRKPIWKRGYDDKGSRRPSHKNHGIHPRFPFGEPEKPSVNIKEPKPFQWWFSLQTR